MDWQSFVTPATPPFFSGATVAIFVAVILWSLVWKGMALWKAAQKGGKVWFVVLLLVNTVGILDILYLYVFSRKSSQPLEAPRM
ncbi:MAG: DUF5652 family protein [Patescibacteria group bacterium]